MSVVRTHGNELLIWEVYVKPGFKLTVTAWFVYLFIYMLIFHPESVHLIYYPVVKFICKRFIHNHSIVNRMFVLTLPFMVKICDSKSVTLHLGASHKASLSGVGTEIALVPSIFPIKVASGARQSTQPLLLLGEGQVLPGGGKPLGTELINVVIPRPPGANSKWPPIEYYFSIWRGKTVIWEVDRCIRMCWQGTLKLGLAL